VGQYQVGEQHQSDSDGVFLDSEPLRRDLRPGVEQEGLDNFTLMYVHWQNYEGADESS
jgi:hypothetical protein